MRYCLLLCCFLSFSTLLSQEVLMADFPGDSLGDDYGPNRKHYVGSYFDLGFIVNDFENTSTQVKKGSLSRIAWGIYYKRKFNRVFSGGVDYSIGWRYYKIKQNPLKTFPDSILHDKERISLGDMELMGYLRTNYGKRGDHLGNYVDLGFFGGWAFSRNQKFEDPSPPEAMARNTETKNQKLQYLEAWYYGVRVRAGWNWFMLYGDFILSDLLDTSFFPAQPGVALPDITVGFILTM